MPMNVLIAGAGPAGIEAALRLRRLAGDRVATTVLAPDGEFTYRPLAVLEPFAAGAAARVPLARIAEDAGFAHHRGTLARVDAHAQVAYTGAGEPLAYDALLIASGAVAIRPYERTTTFTGSPADAETLHGLVQDVESGYTRSVAFVVPPGATWPLPLYELALMLAERAFESGLIVAVQLVTPEPAPLVVFGEASAREVEELLATAGIELKTSTSVTDPAELGTDRVVTLPRLEGPAIPGLPAGFLAVDEHGRVEGVPGVFAAGDVTDQPVKQGGVACAQADAAAAEIARLAGAPGDGDPFTLDLRGTLLTEHWTRRLNRDGAEPAATGTGRALWWPPAKIAGRELQRYFELTAA